MTCRILVPPNRDQTRAPCSESVETYLDWTSKDVLDLIFQINYIFEDKTQHYIVPVTYPLKQASNIKKTVT